jgi:hypothetical protein
MEAWKILSENVLAHFQILTLTAGMYRAIIQECAEKGWIGGRITRHPPSAVREEGCLRAPYTFDLKHFCQLAPDLSKRICAP